MQHSRHSKTEINASIIYFVAAAVIFGVSTSNTLANNSAIYLNPGASGQPNPSPPGDGATSATTVPGDAATQDVPSGRLTSDPEYGTNFAHQNKTVRPRVNLLCNDKVVMTIEPDQLTNEQRGKVMGDIGNPSLDAPYQNVKVSQDQLAKVQNDLAPYPGFPQAGSSAVNARAGTDRYGNARGARERNWISQDQPAAEGYPHYGNGPITVHRPVIKQFCRYLVLLGVVCACIYVAFAAMGVIFGHRNAGSQVIAAVGGLMLLLMAYSIWKVIRFNDDNARPIGSDPYVVDLSHPPGPLPSRGYRGDTLRHKQDGGKVDIGESNLPLVQNGPVSNGRSGLPLTSLGSQH